VSAPRNKSGEVITERRRRARAVDIIITTVSPAWTAENGTDRSHTTIHKIIFTPLCIDVQCYSWQHVVQISSLM